jgi:hypothetical protein
VEDLQGDEPARLVHGIRDLAVLPCLAAGRQLGRHRVQRALDVRREPAGHDESRAAAGALGEVGGELREVARPVLEPGVHRAHDDAVREGDVAEVERGHQVGVVAHRPLVSLVPRVRSRRAPVP